MLLRSSQTLLRLVSNQASFSPLPPNLRLRVPVSMAIRSDSHVFAGNPLLSAKHVPSPGVLHPDSAFQALKSIFLAEQLEDNNTEVKVLAFRKGRPLALSLDPVGGLSSAWRLCWMPPSRFNEVSVDSFVYLGSSEVEDVAYWAVDITDRTGPLLGNGGNGLCFVELRTLMVAAAWTDDDSMGELAIAGHARALLEWHKVSRFCGHCGSNTAPTDSGRRKQCTNESCKKKIYPRVDPVVIMLVIDKENDRALLSRQSRFVPRMWSCLAGFIEPGESLEEAVRRETCEETGIEVGQVVYHSSQPWPVGPNSMPCQLMVGFFAYAKSLEIRVDKSELEDAQWHSREDVKTALTFTDYEKAQRAAAFKVNQMCKGVEKGQNLSSDLNAGGGELGSMFIPGPFAIAHHLIASWAHGTATAEPGEAPKAFSSTSSL